MLDQLYKRFNVPQHSQLLFCPNFKLIQFNYGQKPAKFGATLQFRTALDVAVLERFIF